MRVLMVIDSLVGAGAQKQFTNLAVGLSRREHEIIVYIYHPKYDFLPELEAENIQVVLGKKASRFDISPLVALFKLCRQVRPSIVVSFLRTPSIYSELVRLISPGFGLIVSERSNVLNGKLSLGDVTSGLFHGIADHVVSNCNDYRNYLVGRLPYIGKKMSVIYNGTEEEFFSAYNLIQADEKIDRTTRFVVVSARCVHNKGAMILAEALKLAALSGKNAWEAHWIGPVDFETEYVKTVVDFLASHGLADRWHWIGRSDSVVSQFPQYDALVSPSLHEGVSNVMCEAMAAGLPVVVSDLSDNKDILQGGKFGLLCEVGNTESLYEQLTQFMNMDENQRLELSEQAHFRAKELFSTERFVDEWERLCKEVAR